MKKNIKKLLVIVVFLLMFSLVGCTNNEDLIELKGA